MFAVGERYYLVDLPGYGYARVSQQERAGFRRLMRDVLATRPQVVGVLWLLDIRHPPSADDHAMHVLLTACGLPVLLAITKADKIPRGKRATHVRTILDALEFEEDQCVITSAQSKEGVPELRDAVAALTAPPAGRRR